MQVLVKFFGSVREAVGEKELSVSLAAGALVEDLRALLAAEHAVFDELGERLAASVNFEVVPLETPLREGDEVAFLPPVSGGGGSTWISESPLDAEAAVTRVSGPDTGGIVTFVGAVRDHSRGHSIRHLEYEAYPEMALREMDKIVLETARRWPGSRVAIGHRTGHLSIGETAVVIAAAAPHRAEAFEACRFAIDTLKQTVPIWKREVATDGAHWVDDRP